MTPDQDNMVVLPYIRKALVHRRHQGEVVLPRLRKLDQGKVVPPYIKAPPGPPCLYNFNCFIRQREAITPKMKTSWSGFRRATVFQLGLTTLFQS